ncbi:MAG: hypothetical protein HS108_11565 [Planctomycetes bacterium]|jgi:hypothetical protein|nr:hypothetical protein [Planctomycetota bacterium]MCL4731482.1 hypothetical protein [Planctomycetota bacterium]
MANFFQMLFGGGLDLRKLKVKLREVERERRKYFLDLRKLSASQTDLIEKIKGARREGNQFEVDYLWEELKSMKHDFAFNKRAAKVANLEGIALKKYIRGLERLEKRKDKDGVNKLLQRIRNSGLDAKLALQSIDEEAYLDELNATLDDLGLEVDAEMSDDDPEKEKFLAEIDTINEAEGSGNFEEALKTEAQLKQKLESEEADRA